MSSDPFAPTPLFAFPLFSSLVNAADQHKGPLVSEILALKAQIPGVKRSNRNAWHSGDEFVARHSNHVDWVLGNGLTFAKKALGRYYGDWAALDLKIGHFWANVVGKEGWNAPHHHFPTHWSMVYYIQVGKVGTSSEDMNGMIEFLNPTPWQAVWNRSGNFAMAPKDGLFILFPASLLHFVYPYTGDEPRVSMAWNFNVVPKTAG
ncbi:MAG: hypothetical protein H0V89_01640 [Deltaproteobacteria bacterium]|nr:hypothetical protein [Deltaproteobacteria bacterium]